MDERLRFSPACSRAKRWRRSRPVNRLLWLIDGAEVALRKCTPRTRLQVLFETRREPRSANSIETTRDHGRHERDIALGCQGYSLTINRCARLTTAVGVGRWRVDGDRVRLWSVFATVAGLHATGADRTD
jgi:hypothetical protein